jgi:serine protease
MQVPTSRFVPRALAALLAFAAAAAQAAPVIVIDEVEPNQRRSQAQSVPVADWVTVVAGTMASRSDVDHYRVNLGIGECVAVALTPNPLADLDLVMLNSLGIVLARSEQRGLAQIETLATCGLPLSQTYYFRVERFNGRTGVLGSYALEVAPVPDDLLP